jgi:tRNA G18 (ribose-2'-O)-methylase SpoU
VSMQRCGIDAIEEALDAGEDITLVLALKGCEDPRLSALLDRCIGEGIDVSLGSENDLWRMAEKSPALALGLVGREPVADLDTLLERGGLIWMLAGAQYQTNIGYCIRVAEVSGANGLIVTGEWSSDDRHRIIRAAMRTNRFMPVIFGCDGLEALASWKGRVIAIEDVGTEEPWDADLTGDVILIIGGEKDGISDDLLKAADQAVRIPMAGFTPSYNLQAPMAVVAVEALRQRRS